MANNQKKYQRIRAEEAAELMGWELPQMGGPAEVALMQKERVAEVTVVEEEIAAEKITVSELEDIRESARIEGLSAGLEEGRAAGLEEGRIKGLEQGKEEGYQQGLQQGQAEINRTVQMLQQAINELANPVEQVKSELEGALLDLVLKLSKTVVKHELSIRPELISDTLSKAISQLPEPLGEIQLTVNPEDSDVVAAMQSQIAGALMIEEDPSLSRGSYRLNTLNSFVKHDVDQIFHQVASQLLGKPVPEPGEGNGLDS